MSSIPYINPLSPVQIGGTISVPRDVNFGVVYSTNLVGGYMEVESLDNLIYTVPSGTSGLTQYSGNSIPISFVKGNGTGYSPDVLFLNNDNISSGRRKIGMLVFVREQNQIYQYNIDGYETLWNSATAATGTVEVSYLGTTVNNTSVAGQNFINAWTASTIDGVGGYTSSNAKWKKYYGTNLALTGASFNSGTGTLTLTNITGGTQILTGFGSGGGGGVSGDYLPLSGGTVTGGTIFQSGVTANTISATTYQNLPISGVTNGSGISTSITNGNLTITATGGGSSTGLTPSDYVVQGKLSANQSISANTDVIIQFVDDFDPKNWWNSSTYQLTPTIAGYYNIFVGVWLDNPGVTNNQGNVQVRKNGNSFIIIQNPLNNVTGQAFEASKIVYLNGTTDYVDFTIYQASTGSVNILQGTANGSGTWFSASLIVGGNSAFTGGTILGATNFTGGLTANTISATTYQNLPTDIRTTGSTYSNNTFTFTNNTGGTYSVLFDTVTGLTVNGNLTVTGNTSLKGLTATTISATTYQNLPVSSVTNGTGISTSTVNGVVTVTNTAPDQAVNIVGDSIITVSNSYPNFTLNFTKNLLIAKSTCQIVPDGSFYVGNSRGWPFWFWDLPYSDPVPASEINCGIVLSSYIDRTEFIKVCGMAYTDATGSSTEFLDVELYYFTCADLRVIPLSGGTFEYVKGGNDTCCFTLDINLGGDLLGCTTFLYLAFASSNNNGNGTLANITWSISSYD